MISLKKLLRKHVVSLVHIVAEAIREPNPDPLSHELNKRAVTNSANYVSSRLQKSVIFPDKRDLYCFVFTLSHLEGSYIELGVYKGDSINFLANLAALRSAGGDIAIHGFDSFQGLAEDWKGSVGFVKGLFSLSGQIPKVEKNVSLHVGLFSETLPSFVQENQQPIAFLHVDCDTYESTSQALKILGSQIKHGTIIVFDEYIGFPGWQFGEYLAWQEFVREMGMTYEYLGFSDQTALLRIL